MRDTSDPAEVSIDEASGLQRVIRAVWARDRESMDWMEEFAPSQTKPMCNILRIWPPKLC